jgi:hypothetical protein
MCNRSLNKDQTPPPGSGTLTHTEVQMQRKIVIKQDKMMSKDPRSLDCRTQPRVPPRTAVALTVDMFMKLGVVAQDQR